MLANKDLLIFKGSLGHFLAFTIELIILFLSRYRSCSLYKSSVEIKTECFDNPRPAYFAMAAKLRSSPDKSLTSSQLTLR